MKWLGIMVAALLLATAPGSSSAQSSAVEGSKAKGAAVQGQVAAQGPTFTPDERKAYEKKMTADLEAIDTKIGDLRLKTNKVPPQQKRMMMFHMQYLVNQAATARTQLGNLAKSQGDAWMQGKSKLDAVMQELTRNVADAERKYK
jgi:hypothetical protein